MKEFSFSDLNRRSGDVLDSALRQPVALMKRGKRKVVMLPADDYERIVGAARTRQAFTLDDAPQEDFDALVKGFEEIVKDADRDPE